MKKDAEQKRCKTQNVCRMPFPRGSEAWNCISQVVNGQEPEYWPDVVFQDRCSELRVCGAEGSHQLPRSGEVRLGGGWGGAGDDGQLLGVVVQSIHWGGGEVGGRGVHALTHLSFDVQSKSLVFFLFLGFTASLDKKGTMCKCLSFDLLSCLMCSYLLSESIRSFHGDGLVYPQQRCPAAWQEHRGRLFGFVGRWWRIPRCGDTPPPAEITAGRRGGCRGEKLFKIYQMCLKDISFLQLYFYKDYVALDVFYCNALANLKWKSCPFPWNLTISNFWYLPSKYE